MIFISWINPRVRWGQVPLGLSLLTFFTSSNFSLCRQWLNSSCLRFRVAVSGLKIICHFSLVHRLQTPVIGEKGAARQTTSHLIFGSSFSSLLAQICPASVVFVLPSGFPKSCLWPPYLSLNVFAVRPIYFSTPPALVTLALYTRFVMVHLLGRGHWLGSWQLQWGGGSFLSPFKTLELCCEISFFKFVRHL